ncbi:MAG TPA: thiamine pyridinylase, partial [Methylomirabilota bacterium]|nr:thiamine pyridinylase [Methylomirabilota bacterium]
MSISGAATLGPAPAAGGQQLTVALYPWVPRLAQFRTAIASEWAKVQPSVTLTFLDPKDWDGGYSNDPPASADVYVFDAMFFDYFLSQKWLEPLAPGEVKDPADFVPYAVDGVRVGATYYSIPQLGCANILFYQKSDGALAAATTLSAVNQALSRCTYTSQIPPDRRGLMVDMAGGVTNATIYLDAAHGVTGQYPLPLPWSQAQLNPTAMANVRALLAMASYENGTIETAGSYTRGLWF